MARTRKDHRRETTRLALIEAAESLFGEHGVDNVPLRNIGSAIKSENSGVVTYYFGTKKGLIEAIYLHRLPKLEKRRAELMAAADRLGRGEDLLTLMFAFWLPIYEQQNKDGQNSYAKFIAKVNRTKWSVIRRSMDPMYTVTSELLVRMRKCSSNNDIDVFNVRLGIATTLLTISLEISEDLGGNLGGSALTDAIFLDAIGIAAAALTAPPGCSEILRELQKAASEDEM